MIEKINKSVELGGRTLTLETGFLAMQAHGSILATYGETVVLATVVGADPREDIDFFPLSVEYEERLYAGGIIKGSRWVKREGRPTDEAILNARIIDRSIRPLFPKGFKNDVQVIVTVMSVDKENDPAMVGAIAVSAALKMSGIPWAGPISTGRVGLMDGEFVLNPTLEQMSESDMDLVVSGTEEQVLMVEMGGNEIPYSKIIDAIYFAHTEMKPVYGAINELAQEVHEKLGVPFTYKEKELSEEEVKEAEAVERITDHISENYPQELLDTRNENNDQVKEEFLNGIFEQFEGKTTKNKMKDAFDSVAKKAMRKKIVEEKVRVDGRTPEKVRDITIELSPLPRTHGSAVFKRGETQAMTIATLGSTALSQLIESVNGESEKRYMHHYNFPPYSVGETGRVGSPKRREIGHGALAERALVPVLPDEADFPYTVRLVSEVLSSNGSTSMASTCGSTLALMDAGVPIKEPVSGIAMGLVMEGDDYVVLSDIMGVEDFFGDMDFKVTGTKNGVTALQMDVKIDGLTRELFEKALAQAEEGRAFILGEMIKAIDTPREGLSEYAPKIKSIKIDPKKIGDIIGPGGKIVRAMQEETETEIDIQEDGTVHIAGVNQELLDSALNQIDLLTKEAEVGQVYDAKVTRLMDFGAFCEILPGKEGLVHVSELAPGFVKNVSDVVKEGDTFQVKVIEIDKQGRINLSRKAVMGDDRSNEGGDNNQGDGNDGQQNNKSKVYKMDRNDKRPRKDKK